MSTTVSVAGSSYSVPAEGDSNWANDVSNLLIQLSTSSKVLQVSSSSFPLTQELSFGTSFGLKVQYLKSQSSNPAGSGTLRLGNSESVKWRNQVNNSDLGLSVNSSDLLEFNGNTVLDAGGSGLSGLITDSMVNPSAGITYGKLNLADSIVNADINVSAGIAYSKLTLSDSIVNSDINSSAAISYSKLSISNSIVNADVSSSAAIAYSKLNLSSSIVNADISNSASIAYLKLNLSGSIVNSDISNSAGIAVSKLAPLTASRAMVTDGSGFSSASSVTSTELGYISGLSSNAQTQISGKTDKSTLSATGDMYYASSASTPARLAVGSSGQVLKSVGGIPTWATFSGGINYLSSNPDAEADTSGWTTYADAAGTSPVDGTGGSPNSTWTRSTSSPLRGSGSFLWTKSANNRQGEGVSYAFTIDSSDKAKPLQISFDYIVDSGTFAAGSSSADSDLTVWIYDVTNSTVIQPSNFKLFSNSTSISDRFSGSFQTASNSTSYRLIIHTGSTSASAYSLKFDNFNVGPQTLIRGAAITDWQSFTPTGSWTTNSTYTGRYRFVGDTVELNVNVALSGAPNATTLNIAYPSFAQPDTAKFAESHPGSAEILCGSGTREYIAAAFASAGNIQVVAQNVGGSGTGNAYPDNPATFGNGDRVRISVRYPVLGRSSSVQLSSETDTRVVAFRRTDNNIGTTIPNNSESKITFSGAYTDTHGCWDNTNYRYVVSVPGYYNFSALCTFSANLPSNTISYIVLYVNGSSVGIVLDRNQNAINNGDVYLKGSAESVLLKSGDYVELFAYQNSGSSKAINGNASLGYFQGSRVSGPSQIGASETIAVRASTAAGQSIANSSGVTIVYGTKTWDTHGSWNTSTGVFTAPASGIYSVKATATLSASNGSALDLIGILFKNGAQVSVLSKVGISAAGLGGAQQHSAGGSDEVRLLAGETVQFVVYQTNGGSRSLTTDAAENHISIVKVGNY